MERENMLLNAYTLNEFKKNLLELKEDIINEISENNKFIKTKTEIFKGDIIDQTSTYVSKEMALYLSNEDQKKIHEIDEALVRFQKNQYGKCIQCFNSIDINRLYAIPYTRLCLTCKKENIM